MLPRKKNAIPQDKNICISKEDYEKVLKENERLKTMLEQFRIILVPKVEI